jgi:hypothetical protein
MKQVSVCCVGARKATSAASPAPMSANMTKKILEKSDVQFEERDALG